MQIKLPCYVQHFLAARFDTCKNVHVIGCYLKFKEFFGKVVSKYRKQVSVPKTDNTNSQETDVK